MNFSLKHPVEIKHLNIRKQGNEDNKELAIDIKCFAQNVPASYIAPLFGADSDVDVLGALWRDNSDADVRFTALSSIEFLAYYDNRHEVHLGPHKHRAERVHKFRATLRSGSKVDVEFSITLIEPTHSLVEWLAKNVSEEIQLDLIADPELPLESAA